MLVDRYYGRLPLLSPREYLAKREKLRMFTAWTHGLRPMRVDTNDYEEFLAPSRTGTAASYGPDDAVVRADYYVYGAFDTIGHRMGRGVYAKELDENDLRSRSQIVMNDITKVRVRTAPDASFVRGYLTNMFDYTTGKNILAAYCASVFDTPQAAQNMLTSGSQSAVEHWDTYGGLSYFDNAFHGNYEEAQAHSAAITERYLHAMKTILRETGIEPPLSLEVKVKDHVKRKK